MDTEFDTPPPPIASVTAFQLCLLDGAAMDLCAFWVFCDTPYRSPAGLLREVGAPRIVEALGVLQSEGLIEMVKRGEKTVVTDAPLQEVETSLVRAPKAGALIGYRLTPAGARAWTAYRRPIWRWFLHWILDPGAVRCIGGEEPCVSEYAGWIARAAGCRVVEQRATRIEGWRETYWRPERPGYQLTIHCEPEQMEDLTEAILELGRSLFGDVLGAGRIHPGTSPPPWRR